MKLVITNKEILEQLKTLPLPPVVKALSVSLLSPADLDIKVAADLTILRIDGHLHLAVKKKDEKTLQIDLISGDIQGIGVTDLISNLIHDLPMVKNVGPKSWEYTIPLDYLSLGSISVDGDNLVIFFDVDLKKLMESFNAAIKLP